MDHAPGEKATGVTRTQGLPVGGTASTLALSAFRNRVEQRRTRDRHTSEGSVPRHRTLVASPSVNNLLYVGDIVPLDYGLRRRTNGEESPPPLTRQKSQVPEFVQNVINNSPGCYVDDDGTPEIADRYNFYAHGRRYLFATNSLWYFDETSVFRRRIIWLITSRSFEQVVLALILANSITLALPDLSRIDPHTGELDASNSIRNAISTYADVIFTVVFSIECTLKIIAMGLFIEKGAYLMDPWNWIDFTVVFVGIVAAIPGIPNVSGLRALRVLRPLRFLNAVPGIKKLVTALLRSIPELLSVVAFLSFLFFLYGVIGVQLWSGVLHARCRLTPFPVELDPTLTYDDFEDYQALVLSNASAFRCKDQGRAIPLDDAAWTHDSSPWNVPRSCYWPVADTDATAQTCNIDYGNDNDGVATNNLEHSSYRCCPQGQWCGSDYDNYGNFRFVHPDSMINRIVLNYATYTPNLNYGVTSFDQIGSAALILFICMPREGWSDIMYMLQDAGYGTSSAVYFITFVLIGSFFMLNLALAVIWENFSDQSFMEAEEEREKEMAAGRLFSSPGMYQVDLSGMQKPAKSEGVWRVRLLVQHWVFDIVRTVLILINTVVLSLDQYPVDDDLHNVTDALNFALTIAFTVEAILKFVGLGRKEWLADSYNIFDALVVVISITEVCVSPPEFFSGAAVRISSLSGLRSVRIFALFKLAKYWPSLQRLLSTIVSTIKEIGNFSVLLVLFMYIYALIGMQVFGNRFRFDENGYPVESTVESSTTTFIPRANFDTILWSMVTIFQILTGENWTNVLFDGWRSIGWPCVIYFISLVVLGNFILLNLFLAILLGNFEDQQEDVERLAIEKEDLRRRSRVVPMNSSRSLKTDGGDPSRSRQRRATFVRQRSNDVLSTSAHGSLIVNRRGTDRNSSFQANRKSQGVGDADTSFKSNRKSVGDRDGSFHSDASHKSNRKGQGAADANRPFKSRRKSSRAVQPQAANHNKSFNTPNSMRGGIGGVLGVGGEGVVRAAPMSALALAAMSQKSAKTVLTPESSKPKAPVGRSLYLFGPRNGLRKNAWAMMHHPHFDKILLVLVVLSTIAVALDNPLLSPDSMLPQILGYADYVLTGFFLFEILVKVIAQGFYFQTNAYLKNTWNVMDFVITLFSVVGFHADTSQFKFLKTLRTFRALRPLRLINRNAGMKLVVSSLFAAIPQIVNVLMVVLLMLTIFSILAVNNLKGKLFSCNGDVFDALLPDQQSLVTYPRAWGNLTQTEQSWFIHLNTSSLYAAAAVSSVTPPTSRMICTWLNAKWSRTIPQNFDNVLLGWRTFFEISTTEGWVTIMLASVDATDIDMQPIRNYRTRWAVFFIAFIFCGSFFVIQLFIGVVIENFNRMKEKLDGTFLLSSPQREWLMISEAMLNMRPLRKMKTPRNKFRKLCFSITMSPNLETVTIGCIILNTFIMALHYFGEEDMYRLAIEYCNYFFAIAFTIEAVIKIVGLGRYYWKDSWNIFDFAIVVGSFLGMLYTWVGGNAIGSSASTIRSVRVARLIKLLQTWPSLRQLANTLLITLPSLVSIGGLLFLVFFIYAALGVQLFAKVKMGDLINPRTNFQGIARAMITLMRCATGERWNDLMHELASNSDCVHDPAFDAQMCGFSDSEDCTPLNGCGTQVAFVYFCSFTMLVTFVLLNILIAVILEGFANEKDRAHGVLLPEQYEEFVHTWSVFDPEATGYLEWHQLPKFLQELEEPLGFGSEFEASMKEMQAFITHLDVAVYSGNKVYFYDVARKLGKFVLDVVNGSSVEDLPSNIEVDQKWRTLLKGSKVRKMERATHRVNHIHAAVIIHEAVTSLVFREELKARVQKFTSLTKTLIPDDTANARMNSLRYQSGTRRTSAQLIAAAVEAVKNGEIAKNPRNEDDDADGGAFNQFFEA